MKSVLKPRILVPVGVLLVLVVGVLIVLLTRFDGQIVTLRLRLPATPGGVTEPLLQLGRSAGAADGLGVRYLSGDRISLFIDHWGAPSCESSPQAAGQGQVHLVEFRIDRSNQGAHVLLNGKRVLDCGPVYNPDLSTRVPGKNTFGFTTMGPQFTGVVESVSVSGEGK